MDLDSTTTPPRCVSTSTTTSANANLSLSPIAPATFLSPAIPTAVSNTHLGLSTTTTAQTHSRTWPSTCGPRTPHAPMLVSNPQCPSTGDKKPSHLCHQNHNDTSQPPFTTVSLDAINGPHPHHPLLTRTSIMPRKPSQSAAKSNRLEVATADTRRKSHQAISSNPAVVQHMTNIHQVPRPVARPIARPKHACTECGKVFKRAHNLKIHGRLHNDDRPYGCPFDDCEKEFRWKSSIVSHINWHRTKRGDVLPPNTMIVKSTASQSRANRVHKRAASVSLGIAHKAPTSKAVAVNVSPTATSTATTTITTIVNPNSSIVNAAALLHLPPPSNNMDHSSVDIATLSTIDSSSKSGHGQNGFAESIEMTAVDWNRADWKSPGNDSGSGSGTTDGDNMRLEQLVQELVETGLQLEAKGGLRIGKIEEEEAHTIAKKLEEVETDLHGDIEARLNEAETFFEESDEKEEHGCEFGDDTTVLTPSTESFDMLQSGREAEGQEGDVLCFLDVEDGWDGRSEQDNAMERLMVGFQSRSG